LHKRPTYNEPLDGGLTRIVLGDGNLGDGERPEEQRWERREPHLLITREYEREKVVGTKPINGLREGREKTN
jgi:hypothetical protein